ncbi:MAG: RNA polymerase sigma factor RpoD/SigA [Planctomycetota bacterium]
MPRKSSTPNSKHVRAARVRTPKKSRIRSLKIKTGKSRSRPDAKLTKTVESTKTEPILKIGELNGKNGHAPGETVNLYKKLWTSAELDAALDAAGDDAAAVDRLIVDLNKNGIEISLGFEDPPHEPRQVRARAVDRRDENSDPLAILYREAQRRPRPTRDEEKKLFRRVLFTKRRLDKTLSEFNYPKETIDSFLRNAPCLAFRPSSKAAGAAQCPSDDQAPCIRFAGLCSMEIVHERCCSFHAARNGFVVRYLYLVLGMVRRYRDRGMDTADLVQEGSAALMRAAEDFELERGFRFSTYARWWVNQAFLRTMYNNLRTVRLPVYLQKAAAKVMRHAGDRDFREIEFDKLAKMSGVAETTIRILAEFSRSTVSIDAVSGDRDSAMSLADSKATFRPGALDRPNLRNEIEKALTIVDARERKILKLRFGLDTSLPRTLEEVGEVLNLSRERVRQIQEEALAKLRSPLHLERLRDLLDVD